MIRDNILGLALSKETAARHENEIRSLTVLWLGLEHLNSFVGREEDKILAGLPPDKAFSLFGNAPEFRNAPMELITCCFHWYAVSACNVVKLIGWLFHKSDPSAPPASKYLKRVLPQVKPWRDKVAAHLEMVEGQGNRADRLSSVIPQVGFHDSAFFASLMVFGVSKGGQRSETALKPWSLTRVHGDLRGRYSQ